MPNLQKSIETFLKMDRSPYTNRHYAYTLRPLADAIGNKRDITRISFADLLDYINDLQNLKPSSKQEYVRVIKTFFRWCVKLGYIERSPAEELTVRVYRDDPEDKAMPAHVLAAIVDYSKHHPRNFALLHFLKSTACRRGGVVSLQISNLNIPQKCAKIRKKGGDYYWVQFDSDTSDALYRWLTVRPETDHDFVFLSLGSRNRLKPLQAAAVSWIIASLTEKLFGVKYGPHSIRHLRANVYADHGVPISITADMLGHTTTRNTERYYPRGKPEILARLAEEIDPIKREDSKIIRLFKRALND